MNDPTTLDFTGKTALITGAGSGIGLASAQLLGSRGASIGAVDLSSERLDEAYMSYKSYKTYMSDVSDSGAAAEVVSGFIEEFGRLDTLVLSAGLNGPMGRIETIHPDEVRHLFNVNVVGIYNYLIPAVAHLEASGGSVVLVGSINGSRSFSWAGASPYCASKAAVMALGRSLAVELGPRGIRVNTVCPGSVDTNIHETTKWRGEGPVGRPKKFPEGSMPLTGWQSAEAKDVAEAIAFLASDAAKHITGTELFIDGGQSLA